MSNDEENKAIIRWLDGELSDDDLQKILPREDMLAYKQILNEVDSWTLDNDHELFDVTEITGNKSEEETKVRSIGPWKMLSIAASVVLVIAAFVLLSDFGSTEFVADTGKSIEIDLPDGKSTVTLAAGSSIRWEDDQWSPSGRQMQVEGKAYFKVGKGSPFVVSTANGKVEVLGTEFEVNGFEKTFIVACYEGKVRATAPDETKITLAAGEESVYFEQSWSVKRETKGSMPTWFAEKLSFKDTELAEVFAKLEKTYSVKIVSDTIDLNQKFSGNIPTNNLTSSLKLVLKPFNIKHKVIGKTIYLSK
ncbi:MAG: FecR domain-containing protein [Bacteroidota bacterium]